MPAASQSQPSKPSVSFKLPPGTSKSGHRDSASVDILAPTKLEFGGQTDDDLPPGTIGDRASLGSPKPIPWVDKGKGKKGELSHRPAAESDVSPLPRGALSAALPPDFGRFGNKNAAIKENFPRGSQGTESGAPPFVGSKITKAYSELPPSKFNELGDYMRPRRPGVDAGVSAQGVALQAGRVGEGQGVEESKEASAE